MLVPTMTAWPAASSRTTWCSRPAIVSWPRARWAIWATRLPIVPVATNRPASLPRSSAARSSRAMTVGSSPNTSSPTSASAIARRIAGDGWVTVSLRRSIGGIGGEYRSRRRAVHGTRSADRRTRSRTATTPSASAMLRPRRNWTRGVAAQHASLSRWRSPVRIRSGPPSSAFPYAPSARPDGAFLCSAAHLGILCHTPPRDSTTHAHRRRSRARGARGRPGRVAARARRRAAEPIAESDRLGRSPASRPRRPDDGRARRETDARRRPRTADPAETPTPATPAPPAEIVDVPIVPVTNFRSTLTAASAKDVAAILAGTSTAYDTLALVESEAPAILAALGVADADRPTSSCSTTSRRSPPTSPRTASGWRSSAPTPSGRRSAP